MNHFAGFENSKSTIANQPAADGRGGVAEPLSRRDFLSFVAAAGAGLIWPTTVPNAEARLQGNSLPPAQPAPPPPAGQEASYEWYLPQYMDPTIYTPIGLPADPAETVVTPNGELVYANELHKHVRYISGTRYAVNGLAFALFDGAQIVPIGGALYLLQGTPRRWMEQGKAVKITDAPTWYGHRR